VWEVREVTEGVKNDGNGGLERLEMVCARKTEVEPVSSIAI
jgi:hypothetical protein